MGEVLNPLPSWSSEETWQMFRNGLYHGVFRGAEIQKSADDLHRYQELVEISQPDIVIETGTRAGGSALYFRHELGMQVVSIDIVPQFRDGPPDKGKDFTWVRASSISPSIMPVILEAIKGKRVMVSLDSDHHTAHVQAEIAIYAPLVSPGCYLVVEDGCFDVWNEEGKPDQARVGGGRIPEWGGPLHAVRKAQELHTMPGFWRDESLEALTPISHSPVGWWRKND
jgi:cephalosporin hydroxylase